MAMNGDFGPILSNIQPPTSENISMPICPAKEYAPFRIPLVSLFRFFMKIESQQTLSVTVATTMATQTRKVSKDSGDYRSQNM